MTLPYKIGMAFLGLVLVFGLGYIHGTRYGREAALKAAVAAYQQREKVNSDVQNMDGVALCVALGGVRGQCADLMRRMDEAAGNK